MGAAMSKIKICCLFLVGMLFLSTTANARVCFLAGAEDDKMCLTDTGGYTNDSCPGMVTCAVPDISATSCTGTDGVSYYRPEDCCSDGAIYETCNNGKKCIGGAVCNGLSGGNIVEYCEIGYCGCDDSYSETCSEAGLKGVGEACDGKYKECQCDPARFHICDSGATGGGASCTDGNGTSYETCSCPQPGEGDWVSDPDKCCSGVSKVCTNQSGNKVYKCSPVTLPNCICGYGEGKGTCKSGCTDSKYEYVGNIPEHVVCVDHTLGITAPCGSNCRCDTGYWDYKAECTKQNDNVCADLGYTDTSCSGKWIGCPYNPATKKCLDGESGAIFFPIDPEPIDRCLGYTLTSCPENAECSVCGSGSAVKYKFNNCKDGYMKFETIEGAITCREKLDFNPEPDNWPTVLYINVSGTYPNAVNANYSLQDSGGRIPMYDMTITQVNGNNVTLMDITMDAHGYNPNNETHICDRYTGIKGWFKTATDGIRVSPSVLTGWESYNISHSDVTICAPYSMNVCFVDGSVCKSFVTLTYGAPTATISATLRNNATGETVTRTLTVKTSTLYEYCPDACDSNSQIIARPTL